MNDVRPDPFFVGDSTALDFVNSIAAPRSTEFEWLASGEDVLNWLGLAGLIDDKAKLQLEYVHARAEYDQAAREIRAFREDFRQFVGEVIDAGHVPLGHPMTERLNHLMNRGQQSLCLVRDEDDSNRYLLKMRHNIQSASDLLPCIAAACAEFVALTDFAHVRRCEGSGCTLFFRDVSKNHKRRWCSMEVCGNRAKAAKFRKRS